MPAKSEKQRRLMGAALAIKRGAKSSNTLAKKLAHDMSERQLNDFAAKESFTLKDFLALQEAAGDNKRGSDQKLVTSLEKSVASAFVFYFKAHSFHWNVEGNQFAEYHKMFGEIYEDVYDSIDAFAEHLRALDAPAPRSLAQLIKHADINETDDNLGMAQMKQTLLNDNEQVIKALDRTMAEATKHNKQGLMNFLATRIEQHNKWSWFLRASLKD